MPLPLLGLLAGGAVLGGIGNLISGGANKRAAEAQAAGYAEGSQQLQDQYQQGQQATQVYREGGEQAFAEAQALQTPEGRAQFYAQYGDSPEGQQMAQQAEESILRNASATGGMRTGQTNVALSTVMPQLANQAYQQKFQGLQQLYQPGFQAATQTAGLAPQVGQQMGQYSVGQGGAQGQANSAMGNAWGNTVGQFGGLLTYAGQGGIPGFGGGGTPPPSGVNMGGQSSPMGFGSAEMNPRLA